MSCTNCLVSIVCGCHKNPLKEQELVAGGLTRQLGFVLVLLALFCARHQRLFFQVD
jgi:hypothetical protein